MGYFRDLMALGVGCKADQLLYVLPAQVELAKELGQRLGVATILAMLQVLDQTAARMRVSVHGRTLAEMALVRVCSLQDLDGVADAVATVRAGGSIASGAAVVPTGSAMSQASGELKKNTEPVVMTATNVALDTPPKIAQIPSPNSQILSDALAAEWWQSAATRAGGLLSDLVAQTVEVRAANGDRMLIRVDRPLTKQLCEQPTQRSELESLVATCSGRRISLQFEVAEGAAASVVVAPPPRSRRQLQEEVAAQPFVKKALELFGVDSDAIRYLPPQEEG
jgi:DNA polymerase-3 subunit gamma/tau